jgi:hypothetical protein
VDHDENRAQGAAPAQILKKEAIDIVGRPDVLHQVVTAIEDPSMT